MRLTSLFCLLLTAVLVSSCLPHKPSNHWQMALQGAYSASIGPKGNTAVIGSLRNGGSFWDIAGNARLYNWNHREGYLTEILYSDISADGYYAVTANYYNIVLWDTRTGKSVWFWSAPARIEAVDLSADGRFAVLGLGNNKAVLFDVQNGGVLREFQHNGPVTTVSINVAAKRVLTGSQDRTAKLWDIANAKLIKEFDYNNQVNLVKLSDSGELALMVPAYEKAELWQLSRHEKIADLSTAKFQLYSARFIGDQALLVGTTHRNIFRFDTQTGKKTDTWQIGTEALQSFKSAIVLDVGMRGQQLLAIASNGYLYGFSPR